jgi:hypothetical protein
MGVPTPEVGYTAAMPRREDHEVHKDVWWHWTSKQFFLLTSYPVILFHAVCTVTVIKDFDPLNAELNPSCHLLAL